MPRKAVKMFNVILVHVGYPKKPDLLLDDKSYDIKEVMKEGQALADEHGYTTFKIQEAKKKRAPRKTAVTKSKPKTATKATKSKPTTTTKTTRTRRKKTDAKANV